jgi:uncharacterized protein
MARPRKPFNCTCPDRLVLKAVFKPASIPLGMLECTTLFLDELECLHLCDGLGKTQAEAGECMGVSRGTVQRLLSEARRKVADVLIKQKALAISSRYEAGTDSTHL